MAQLCQKETLDNLEPGNVSEAESLRGGPWSKLGTLEILHWHLTLAPLCVALRNISVCWWWLTGAEGEYCLLREALLVEQVISLLS